MTPRKTKQSLDGLYWPVLVPYLEPGKGNRLLFIRRDDSAVRSAFEEICEEWQRLALAHAEDAFYVYALPEETMRLRSPGVLLFDVPFISHIKPIGSAQYRGNPITFAAMCGPGSRSACNSFISLATRAGIALPASIKRKNNFYGPDSPAVEWLSAMWRKCQPESEFWVVTKQGPKQPHKSIRGWTWRNPFASAVEAADSFGLVDLLTKASPQQVHSSDGEWSNPLSKTEIVRLITGRRTARPRDLDRLWGDWEKQQEPGSAKWIIRLDTLKVAYYRRVLREK